MTDPSGYFFFIAGFLAATIAGAGFTVALVVGTTAAVIGTLIMGGTIKDALLVGAIGLASALGTEYIGHCLFDDALSLSDFNSALGGAGQLFFEMSKAAAHGVFQSGLALIQGGDSGSSFLSAFASSMFGWVQSSPLLAEGLAFGYPEETNAIPLIMRTVAAAIVGGSVSEIGGGKFGNGAIVAAFVHIFNAERMGKGKKIARQQMRLRQKRFQAGAQSRFWGAVGNGAGAIENAIVDPHAPGSEIVAGIEGAGSVLVDGTVTFDITGNWVEGGGGAVTRGWRFSWNFREYGNFKTESDWYSTISFAIGYDKSVTGNFGFYAYDTIDGSNWTVNGGYGVFSSAIAIDSDFGGIQGVNFGAGIATTKITGSLNANTTLSDSHFKD